jgi:hypothetical protein
MPQNTATNVTCFPEACGYTGSGCSCTILLVHSAEGTELQTVVFQWHEGIGEFTKLVPVGQIIIIAETLSNPKDQLFEFLNIYIVAAVEVNKQTISFPSFASWHGESRQLST